MAKKEGVTIHRRFALLIGVNEYEDPGLSSIPQTTHDVVGLEGVLKQFGYEVRTLHCHQCDPKSKPTINANFNFEPLLVIPHVTDAAKASIARETAMNRI